MESFKDFNKLTGHKQQRHPIDLIKQNPNHMGFVIGVEQQ
jgi:hypothetical protein